MEDDERMEVNREEMGNVIEGAWLELTGEYLPTFGRPDSSSGV